MKKDIVFVGSTTLDYIFPDRRGIISGSGARGAMAAAAVRTGNARVTLVTMLGRGDALQDKVRSLLEKDGIHIFSRPDAKLPVSVYDDGYGKQPSNQHRDPHFAFDPAAVPGIETLSPAAAVFSGGQTVYNLQRMETYAKNLSNQGATVIIDINSRKPVDEAVSQAWARSARIVKLAAVDIPHLMNGSTDMDAAAKQFLDWGKDARHGAQLVCITLDGEGTKAYWREQGELKTLLVPPSERLSVKDDIGAGDAFDGGVALAVAELGITADTIGTQMNQDIVRQIVQRGNETAVQTLRANNGPEAERPEAFRDVTDGQPLESIVASIYRPETIRNQQPRKLG